MTDVEVVERDRQALQNVRALLGAAQVVLRPPRDDVDAVLDVVVHHLAQAERARAPVDEARRC